MSRLRLQIAPAAILDSANHKILMEELVSLVVQKTGISQEDARKSVEVVVNTLKSRLPGLVASHVDSFLTGGMTGGVNTIAGEATEMLKGKLGGLFGGGGKG
jgi:hypothetical protein